MDQAEAGKFHDFCLIVDAYQADGKLGGNGIVVARKLMEMAELFLRDDSRDNSGLDLANALRYANKLRTLNPSQSCLNRG